MRATYQTASLRIQAANGRDVARNRNHVLYWMVAARRSTWSFALDHAIARATALGKPLVVFEPLRAGYRWASDRHHTFVMQGMADNAKAFANAGITYHAYVEPTPGDSRGLLEAMARDACLVITDEQPGFFLPTMVAAAATKLAVRVETVDGNGVVPLRFIDRAYPSASTFRRAFQKLGPPHLLERPHAKPLARIPKPLRDADLPKGISKWRSATDVAKIPIDHSVEPVSYRGGSAAAAKVVDELIDERLDRYLERNHPDADAASGLSPYLHFGHVSAQEVVARVLAREDWDPSRLGSVTGRREGWWGVSPAAEAFLDELITWRELGYGYCFHVPEHESIAALPAWARATLATHAKDLRPEKYTRAELERADTADPIWNAAQRELLREGRIHNYLRMLWGKKIFEWSPSPKAALETLFELNNKYAVDGRDPNSASGILWTLGLFDRPWPERPIYGTVRYMTSASTARKLDLDKYLARFGR